MRFKCMVNRDTLGMNVGFTLSVSVASRRPVYPVRFTRQEHPGRNAKFLTDGEPLSDGDVSQGKEHLGRVNTSWDNET